MVNLLGNALQPRESASADSMFKAARHKWTRMATVGYQEYFHHEKIGSIGYIAKLPSNPKRKKRKKIRTDDPPHPLLRGRPERDPSDLLRRARRPPRLPEPPRARTRGSSRGPPGAAAQEADPRGGAGRRRRSRRGGPVRGAPGRRATRWDRAAPRRRAEGAVVLVAAACSLCVRASSLPLPFRTPSHVLPGGAAMRPLALRSALYGREQNRFRGLHFDMFSSHGLTGLSLS